MHQNICMRGDRERERDIYIYT